MIKKGIIFLCFFVCMYTAFPFSTIEGAVGEWRETIIWNNNNVPLYNMGANTVQINGRVHADETIILQNGSHIIINDGGFLIAQDIDLNANNSITVNEGGVLFVYGSLKASGRSNLNVSGRVVVANNILINNPTATVLIQDEGRVYALDNASFHKGVSFPGNNEILGLEQFLSDEDDLLFLLSGEESPLPIILSNFNVFVTPQKVNFAWTTESEIHNDFFTLEYSTNGIDFTTLANIPGAGNSSVTIEYSYIDVAPKYSGLVYFRLKQTDYDGSFEYSHVLSVMVPTMKHDLYVYPNPASNYVCVNDEFYTVSYVHLYSKHGQKLDSFKNQSCFDISMLASGFYLLEVYTEDDSRKLYEFVKQ